MKKNDDIDKIDEQIDSLKEEEKASSEEETKVVETIKDLNEKKESAAEEVKEEIKEEVSDKTEEMAALDDDGPVKVPKEKKEKKNKIILWIILGIVLVIAIVLGIIFLMPKKTGTDAKRPLTESERVDALQEYGEALEGIIGVYLENKELLLDYQDAILLVKYEYEVECDEHEIYEDGKIYLNKCVVEDEQVSTSYGKKQKKEELKEGAIKVYVYKKNNNATLKEPSDLKEYDVYSFDIDGKYYGLNLLGEKSDYVFYSDENNYVQMVNYKTRKKALESVEYTSIYPIYYDDKFDQEYAIVLKYNKHGVYKLDTEEASVPVKYNFIMNMNLGSNCVNGPTSTYNAIDSGVIAVVISESNGSNPKFGTINYRTNKEIIPVEYRRLTSSGKYLWVVDEYGIGHILTLSGKEILKDRYDELYYIIDGKYVLVKEDDEIILVTNEGKEIYNYGKLDVSKFNYGMSYRGGAAFMFNNPNADPESANGQCIEVLYYPDTKEGLVKETVCGGVAKPVLYLYPEETTNVTVTFDKPKLLETTYPKYIDKWEVTANPNGDLYDKDGKYYYGLYWDEEQVHYTDFKEGFYVTKDNAIEFLEEKLSIIGLSDRERNEFIMYWLPILEKNEKNLVYFELTEERERVNKINITPKPDSLLRIVIHIKKVDKEVNIKEEKLTTFERVGFTAVEWGGANYK